MFIKLICFSHTQFTSLLSVCASLWLSPSLKMTTTSQRRWNFNFFKSDTNHLPSSFSTITYSESTSSASKQSSSSSKKKPGGAKNKSNNTNAITNTNNTTTTTKNINPQDSSLAVTGTERSQLLWENYNPPGFSMDPVYGSMSTTAVTKDKNKDKAAAATNTMSEQQMMEVLEQKAWTTASGPIQQVFYIGFMTWMSGNSVHIFSIMTLMTALFMAMSALFKVHAAFAPLEAQNIKLRGLIWPQKACYAAICILGVALALRKFSSLGFLPTTESDWIALFPRTELIENVAGGLSMWKN